VSLRDAWESEAGGFTPWLAQQDNITVLAEAIGLDLEVEAQERNVGPFRADILCKNTADDTWVLIENQLERTDHAHLGQLLTYAAGLEAVTIIWVSQRFTEEHRATLDWLNQITDDEFNFFGVEVELFRIDESPVAPHFNIVSKPNDWSKTVSKAAKGIESGNVTPTKQRQLEFWTRLRAFAETKGSTLRFQKPLPQHWTTLGIGRLGFTMWATVSMQEQEMSAQLVINTDNPKADFRQLLTMKEAIERESGEVFTWREQPDKVQSRIELRRKATPDNEPTWPELQGWLVQKLEMIQRVFGPRLKSLTLAEPSDPATPASPA
jgi:hypothetical protein